MNRPQEVDQREVQGNILCGYGNSFAHAVYLFIRFGKDAQGAREWLGELVPSVTTAEPWRPLRNKPAETLNIAFTHRGLKRLGLPKSVRKTFPADFREGMLKRHRLLGDSDASDPQHWELALRKPHAVVIVTAQTDVLGAREAKHRERLGARGTITLPQQAHLLEGAREHFGFSDGFSQPAIRGNAGPDTRDGMGTPTADGWDPVAPGEFVLGYPGEDDLLPYAPSGPLGQGGSYMVLRKLYQDVPAFREYLQTAAGDNEARQLEVAAKMVGRWQDGRSLVTSGIPEAPPGDPALDPDTINRFRYRSYGGRDIDPHGVRCPIGAHVRRANPRDSLGFEGVLAKRHRIIRRGMPYGKPLPKESKGDDADRGLIFVAYQSSIERQFEFIQSRWLNDGDNFWLGEERDFLSPGAGMTVPGPQAPTYLPAREHPFVTTRGGDYFFAPGLPALRALAAGYWL